MWQGKGYSKKRHYPIFSKKVLEGIFLEMSNSLACIIPFFSLFILTFGFGYKNAWLNSKNINFQSSFSLLVKTVSFFETKCNATPKDRAL